MNPVRLGQYNNSWYYPGRSRWWQMAWFFFGLPLLRCALLPSSGFRVWLLRLFGARISSGVVIKPGIRVKYPWHLQIGQDCWLGEDCWIDNLTEVHIGDNVCISQGAYLCTGNHNWSDPAFGLLVEPIVLRNCSWVGARALIGPGVVMGQCAVAAAGSVINKSVPEFEVYAGNPAHFVRRRRVQGTAEIVAMPNSTRVETLL